MLLNDVIGIAAQRSPEPFLELQITTYNISNNDGLYQQIIPLYPVCISKSFFDIRRGSSP
jgi:hypothetical protein